jgi:L-malate glycosyltransferase
MLETLETMHVLMLLEGEFPTMGGAERQMETLALALTVRGERVTVLLPRLRREYPAGPGDHRGLRLFRIGYPALRLLGRMVLMLRLSLLLLRWRHQYDAIHVHIAHHMGAVAALIGRMLGKPVVVKFSGWWEAERGALRPRGLLPKLQRLLLRRASAVQAISTRIGRDLVGFGFDPARVHWLPNAVDPTRFRALEPRFPESGPHLAVFVGRLVPEKALDLLLEAWARALGERSDWRLRLVGDGELESALRAQAQRLGIAERIEFAGRSERVEDHLAQAEVGILVSHVEGLSNTLLEYMCAGLPVLGTRISGSEDFIREGETGWQCEPGQVESLAAALGRMAEASAVDRARQGAEARHYVLAQAGLDSVLSRLQRLYRGQRPAAQG